MQDAGYWILRISLSSGQSGEYGQEENEVGLLTHPHRGLLLPQPYISALTTKYTTSAHEPISAAPESHNTPITNRTGISKNRSKALPTIPADEGAAEEVLAEAVGLFLLAMVIAGAALAKATSSPFRNSYKQ
jgi:hypothetical protein